MSSSSSSSSSPADRAGCTPRQNETKFIAPANHGKIDEPLAVMLRQVNHKVMSTPSDLDELLAVKSSGATGILWK